METTPGRLGRRTFLRGVGAAGAAAASGPWLIGCGSGADDSAVSFFFGANPEERETRMKIIDAFHERNPDIKIRTIEAGPDPLQQMLTFCAGDKCPDVMMAWELTYTGLAKRGVLQDLNEQLSKDPGYRKQLQAQSSPTLFQTYQYDDAQYALPEQFAGVFLYYNKKLFDEAGLKPPPKRWEEAWTFDEFLETAKALTKRDSFGKTTQWGVVDPWTPYLSAGIFAMNNGVEWFSPAVDPTHNNMGDERFIEGWQFYADLSTKHRVAPQATDTESVSAQDMFAQGTAGMAILGHWAYPAFSAAEDLDFDVTVLPVGPHGGTGAKSDVGTTGLAVAANSPRRDEAWEFVKFAGGPEGQQIIAESGLFIPVLSNAVESEGFKKAHQQVENLEVFNGALTNANYLPITPAWGKIETLLVRQANRVLRGAASATSFKDDLVPDVNDLLKAP